MYHDIHIENQLSIVDLIVFSEAYMNAKISAEVLKSMK